MGVDALLVLVLSTLVWQHGKAGLWVVLSGLLRYFFVAASWPWPWMARPLPPSRRRQSTCVVQIVALVVTMLPFVVPPASSVVAAAALALLSWSFLVDALWLARQ
jgi:phosphatidylglycerophosphate synthase